MRRTDHTASMTPRASRRDSDVVLSNFGHKEHLFKFLVIGDYGVGKTALVRRYTEGKFSSNYKITIGADFAIKTLDWDPQTKINLQLWDIAGHERFGYMTRVYYKYAVAAALVFDISRAATFQSMKKWLNDLREKVALPDGSGIPVVLLANKCDISVAVTDEQISKFCRENKIHAWYATSAKNNTNVGHYLASTQNASTLNMTKEEMYNLMCKELEEGCVEYPEVKAGFIGEVGSNWPIEDFEKRAICATAEVQAQLRCSVSFHPGRNASAPMEIMRIYQEAGGDASRAIMSHVDRTLIKKEQLMEFADATKCYIQFDLFGIECSFYQLNPFMDFLSDAQRVKRIALLKKEKKLDRVLMSHDIHTKHRLIHFGGHGYSHIANNVVPTMINKGFTTEEIELITAENPKKWLTRQ
ncbi:Phosphotriesterase-related protein [Trachymyrmex septentrionalis]|uniref:Phosphotriesterase-related protein n=1 Tax=Trachymyrmex septentrionalis TaxID=34720 RepID=A0A195F8T8_9HYME|nr:Phosphotriesterase-related protein [Trachymyrmex septentrionalis]